MGQLHVVSGKGGTGKTTVALALARTLSGRGRVLVCEAEGRGGLAQALGLSDPGTGRETPVPGWPGVTLLGVDARAALEEYLDKNFRLGLAGRALDRFGLVDFATTIAPGLRDMLLLGKVYEAARRPGGYSAVVFDAPPTGRILGFLTAGDALSDVAKVGPVHAQAQRIMSYVRSSDVRVHLVATPAEMPVRETVEAWDDLRRARLRPGRIIANRCAPVPPDGDVPEGVPDAPRLRALLTTARERAAAQASLLEELRASDPELITVPERALNLPARDAGVAAALSEVIA